MSEFQVYAKLNGNGFAAWELNKLSHQGIDFTCPYCNLTMRPVMGKKRRWHFRHLVKGKCSGGGESEFHFQMKYWFVLKAQDHGIKYHVEKSVKDQSVHRPDVILYLDEQEQAHLKCKGVAIEFQNSPIGLDSLNDRNKTYLNQNFTPWWVFGGQHYQTIKSNILKLNLIEKDIFSKLFNDFETITFLENNELWFLVSKPSESMTYEKVNFLDAWGYHQGKKMPILDESLKKYNSKRRGFFIKKGRQWVGYPLLLKQYKNILSRRVNSLERKTRLIKSKITVFQKLEQEILRRFGMIDNHPVFYSQLIDKYLNEINEKEQISYSDSIEMLVSLNVNQNVAANIIRYLEERNQIFRKRGFLQSIGYLEKTLEKQKIILENKTKSVFFEERGQAIQIPVWVTPETERQLMDYIVFELAITEWNCKVWLRENVDKTIGDHNAQSVLRYLMQIGKITYNTSEGWYYPNRKQ